ncbi:putative pumilio/PUF RNA binding protein 7 [Trypanosoma grayi]|uniref:putative pumilio/PUF RNA binding protein 7 n=1 Tax=Trypanosoma grayi TaxID=71804 RepID=UPI0004F48153|nr:putative pumilio/PUF RNA binding protein 7 [Trypanosoma grayi]KEG12848.1 putative pumilio/PUF RNA binding protein 7 [Trypanosoma grayi]
MPGMRLDFLKNTSQRAATGKALPLKQVEAIILYGRPEQRAKVVQKLLPNTYSLCMSKATHHLLLSLLAKCDNLIRVQMLYQIRRKISDLSLSPVGNIIVQEMLDKLPPQQKKEIAEVFVLNTELDEFRRLCEHPFGNHVAQKLMEYHASREVVEERFVPHLRSLSVHPYGQRVVAKYMECEENGWSLVAKAIFGTDIGEIEEDNVYLLFKPVDENMTVSALMRHPLVPGSVKDALCAHLCEYASEYLDPKQAPVPTAGEAEEEEFVLPDFGNAPPKRSGTGGESELPRHHHAYVTLFEKGDLAQQKLLWESLLSAPDLIEHLVSHKATVAVAVAALKTLPESHGRVWAAMTKADGATLDIVDVAQHPARTMILRAMIEVRSEFITESHRLRLAEVALALSQNPVSSPVLQKLLECFPEDESTGQAIFKNIKGDLQELVTHNAASYLIGAMLQHGSGGALREQLVNALLDSFTDMHQMLSFAQGSRVMQKLVAYASDEAVVRVIETLIAEAEQERDDVDGDEADAAEDEGDEEEQNNEEEEEANGEDEENEKEGQKKLSRREVREMNRKKHYEVTSHAIVSYALHSQACYVIQALLRECRSRQLDQQRKRLMNELKPFVFELAISPWAGRIVLDTMMQCGSAQLREAMKNVAFLKAEAWLSDVSEKDKKRGGGLDPTLRQTLRRNREETEGESHEGNSSNNNSTKRPPKKLYRTLKK